MTPNVYREGKFRFGALRIPCMVLNDGAPMLTVRALRMFLGLPSVPGVMTSCVRLDDGEVITDAITTEEFVHSAWRYFRTRVRAEGKRRSRGSKWARGGVDLDVFIDFMTGCARAGGIESRVRKACDFDPAETNAIARVALMARSKVGLA